MSGVPGKRPHEDVGGGGGGGSNSSGSSKYPHVDSAVVYPVIAPKLPSSAGSSEYVHHHSNPHSHPQPMDHTPSPDPRVLPKVPRSDSSDKRPTMFPVYPRLSSSANDYPHPDNTVVAFGEDNKLDSRENVYNRDPKGENRETGRENRGDEGKDMKFEREPYQSEHKTENVKLDKEGFGSGGSHLHLKDSKDHHRAKRYADTPGVNAEMWNASRSNTHGPCERDVGKDVLAEQRNPTEVHEAVGENKVDFKAEDRLKEKDRKRKEFKQRDWGERDRDRSDHRINLQISSGGGGEGKESLKEEREGEKWEREKKDSAAKDKEKPKEREKDHSTKREASNGADKDGLQSDKELVDAVVKPPEVESAGTDAKRLRDHDSWKTNDKETRERKKERDADLEGERPEKRSRYNDKESDDGCPDAEAGSERDGFTHGVQQRKRMLRPQGSPQASNREQRVSSRTQENEGSQGKSDVSIVTYRVGECMQELLKLWTEYLATQDKSGESSQNGPTLEIRIPAEHVSATNRQVRGGQLWGTDVYTNDSDLVAVLMHTGYCRPTASAPPSAVQELRATIRVLPPRDCYISTLRNNVRSRAWGAGISCSYRVELCCILKRGGGTIELEPCLTQTSTVEPTLAPVTVERTMTTRAAASNALRQQRFVREVTIQYNLCNEPWIKYSISVVADKGLKKALYTSARLKKGEVLYLETHTRRYELCFMGEKTVKSQTHDSEQNHGSVHTTNGERRGGGGGGSDGVDTAISIDVFRWSRCKRPLPQKVMQSLGIPLPSEHVEVLEENLDWEDIQWSQTGVFLAGKEYLLARAHFISP